VTLVIFGGAGDLAHRKLLPALYNLYVDGLLPDGTAVVAVGRRDFSDDQFREFARDGIQRFSRRPIDEARWAAFAKLLYFVNIDLSQAAAFSTLGSRLDIIEHEQGRSADRIYYLAIPPSLFVPTVEQLARARFVGPMNGGPYARVIVEKPIRAERAKATRRSTKASLRSSMSARSSGSITTSARKPFRTSSSCASRTVFSNQS
jgi:glucose-6-phosphate 1-dehydrogenase